MTETRRHAVFQNTLLDSDRLVGHSETTHFGFLGAVSDHRLMFAGGIAVSEDGDRLRRSISHRPPAAAVVRTCRNRVSASRGGC
jgi:hypothetical protein